MSYVLDSTVFIDVLRDHQGALAFLRGVTERPAASEVTRVETIRGLRARERAIAERLFALVDWHPVDEPIARVAGDFGREFRRSHANLGSPDLIIAATARALDLPLASSNVKHYPMFRGLEPPY